MPPPSVFWVNANDIIKSKIYLPIFQDYHHNLHFHISSIRDTSVYDSVIWVTWNDIRKSKIIHLLLTTWYHKIYYHANYILRIKLGNISYSLIYVKQRKNYFKDACTKIIYVLYIKVNCTVKILLIDNWPQTVSTEVKLFKETRS